jgi:CBS domain containing-hemolysin-like protein
MAVASMVLGIIALVLLWIPFIGSIAPVIAIAGIVLGVLGKKQLSMAGQPSGTATAGVVLSAIALVISTIFTIICGSCALLASCF